MSDVIRELVKDNNRKLIQDALGISFEPPFNWFGDFFFDQNLDAYWSISDLALYPKILKKKHPNSPLMQQIVLLFRSLLSRVYTPSSFGRAVGMERVFFFATKNGLIKIDLNQNRVTKIIVPPESEPDLLQIEEMAARYFQRHAPKLYKATATDQFCLLEHEFIHNNFPLTKQDWPTYIEKVIPDLVLFYQQSTIKPISSKQYIASLDRKIDSQLQESKYLKSELRTLSQLFRTIISKKFETELQLYKTCVHGDLTYNNIIRTPDNWYLFDWSNGGELNLFYDLMIQEYYLLSKSFVWSEFHQLTKPQLSSKHVFFGAFETFENELLKSADIALSVEQVKLSLLISLLELALKNFQSYQYMDRQTGREMLIHVISILQIVNNSE